MFDIKLGAGGEVVLSGRFDAAQADRAEEFMDRHVTEPTVVDFKELEYISSAGLGVFLKTQKKLMETGGGLRFINMNRHIHDIFRFSGFDKIFEIEPVS